MSSERCNSNKSSLIRSSQVNLGLPIHLFPSTVRASTALTGAVVCLLFTCLNHLNLPSFSRMNTTFIMKCSYQRQLTHSR
ncbi:hypothetical protein Hanom_Chr11g00979901 [Helianthus anomalus]